GTRRIAMAHRNPRVRLFTLQFAGDFSYPCPMIFFTGPDSSCAFASIPDRPVRWVYCHLPVGGPHCIERESPGYGDNNRVRYLSHYVQGFLFLLLALDERRGCLIICLADLSGGPPLPARLTETS